MKRAVFIRGGALTPDEVYAVACDAARVELTDEARGKLAAGEARLAAVERRMGPVPLWKIADLADDRRRPPEDDLRGLARRLLLDHAAAVGEPLPTTLARAALLARIDVFAQGGSGVRPVVAETMAAMLNAEVHPLIPSRGHFSVAGDVAPLAHLALTVCANPAGASGRATVGWRETGAPVVTGASAMAAAGLTPIEPTLKESFSLVVGTSFSVGWAALLLVEARRLHGLALAATALTCEAVLANPVAFEPALLGLGPGRERIVEVGRRLLDWTAGSELLARRDGGDAFSIRCAPQVLGTVGGALTRVGQTIADELRLLSDNPILLDGADGPRCLEGGNFHGARLALALDNLRVAMAEVGALSERHAFLLTNGARNGGLPSFLIENRGLNSGFMLAQYTAAALVSENKALALPYSTDSIPSCQDFEDYAGLSSQSAAAAAKLLTGVRRIVAIELLLAAQGVDLRLAAGKKPGARAARLREAVRTVAPHWTEDTALYRQIEAVDALCRPGGELDRLANEGEETEF
jgi:histidine ammonia-lyase